MNTSDASGADRAAGAAARLRSVRSRLGEDLLILGHHYQSDAVLGHVDLVGDSLKLSRLAAERRDARYIVFCGVNFMAETADILAAPDQKVFLPDARAGCPMADMAPMDQVEQCWDRLTEQWGRSVIPITYVNSSAELKAFCGLRGGAACTSSNAEAVMAWALDSARRVLFLPDRHLGRNTARALGVADREISLWDRGRGKLLGDGGAARVILWQGCCPVHDAFSLAHVQRVRRELPGVRVIVHPECPSEVLDAADEHGSTEEIIARAGASGPGAQWAVGTEINLVRRLARLHRDKIIAPLSASAPPCADMARITPGALLAVLEDLAAGEERAAVRVAPETARGAVSALERMLTLD